ncbi:MAG: YicC/YloC family endoribonuclease [Candidatus Neomarinimicrobiota bacterium]|tara:strand:- start:1071 stop:1934 length:864 start_codon:yes stop_codon:yes gene_type:complete
MILSMTGFGHSVIDTEVGQLSASVRSVNSRYLDIKIRGLNIDPKVEREIKQLISNNLIRGSVQIIFEIGKNSSSNNSFSFNKDRFEAIDETLKLISQNYSYTINPGDFLRASDLLLDNRLDNLNSDDIIKITNEAISQLNEMRELEGDIIYKDLVSRINSLKEGVEILEKLNKSFAADRKEKLQARLQKLLGEYQLDESRLIQEVAILVERADVTEEIVRLKSHYEQLDKLLVDGNSIGKRFTFLIQEVFREINTIGSKNSSVDVINQIIFMKDELEKIREQAQNIL